MLTLFCSCAPLFALIVLHVFSSADFNTCIFVNTVSSCSLFLVWPLSRCKLHLIGNRLSLNRLIPLQFLWISIHRSTILVLNPFSFDILLVTKFYFWTIISCFWEWGLILRRCMRDQGEWKITLLKMFNLLSICCYQFGSNWFSCYAVFSQWLYWGFFTCKIPGLLWALWLPSHPLCLLLTSSSSSA